MFDVVRWRGRLASAAVVALGIAPLELAAQTRGTISGVIREAERGRPIDGAQVFVTGTTIGATTSASGRYTLVNVPAGTHTVQARLIGYSSQSREVVVTAGAAATLDFNLARSVITLDEVVVTGTGVATEKRKLGNTVATIDASALENKPITSFSEVLQGREPGVVMLPSGGLTGEGAQIRIRGTKSLSQSNEPIVYLNGVRIDNAGGRGNIGTGGGGLPSRLDDIDPNSIERVEVLKGAAAATLYGSEASSGVIQIFTKRGSAEETRWNFEVEQGLLRYPGGAFEPNAGFVTSQAEATRLGSWWNMNIQPYQVFERDFVGGLLGTGHSQVYSLSVSGGAPILTYFVSGRYQGEDGPINADPPILRCDPTFAGCRTVPGGLANDNASRAQGTLSLMSSPREDIQLRMNTMFTEAKSNTISNNNNIYAPVTLAMFGQPQRASCVTTYGSSQPIPGTGRCQGVGNPLGQATFATVREALHRNIEQDVRHFNGSIGARYTPATGVALDATFGVDVVGQHDTFFHPYGYNVDLFTANNVEGARTVSDRNHRELSLDTKLSWETAPRGAWTSQFVGGVQGYLRRTQITGGSGTAFPGPGFEVAEAGGVHDVDEFFISVVNAGLFAQEQIGWRNWIFGTVGARYDYSSAFGEAAGGALYPKASISIIPSDRPGWNSQMLSTLRLRAAVGQSGLQPGAFDKLTTYSSIRSTLGPGIQPFNLGNPDLKPEVSTEWEVGAEVGVLNNRAALEITYWDRTVNDALVQRQYPVTGGFLNRQLANIGQIDSRGLEVGLRGTALQRDNFQLSLFANAAYLKETLTDLGGAPPVKVGGSYPRYRNWLREGFAPGSFFGPIVRNVEYPIDTNGDCQPDSRADLLTYFAEPRQVSAFAVLMEGGDPRPCSSEKGFLLNYLGKPTPDWAGSFGGSATVFRNFEIATQFEYKAGNFYVHNLTDAFRRAHLALGGNLRAPTEVRAIMANPASTPEQRVDAAVLWARRYAALTPYDGLNEVERADFVRWRELSLTYTLAPAVAARVAGARSVALTLSARNLALWTRYSGADPEINLLGRTQGPGLDNNFAQGIDAFGLPLPRRFSLAARVGF